MSYATHMNETAARASETRAFRDACGAFATGVAIASARAADGSLAGMVINSFSSLSLEPMWVQWAVARSAPSFRAFESASHFGISVLALHQAGLVRRFTRGGIKFVGMDYLLSPEGVPLIPHSLATFSCHAVQHRDAGDHLVLVGEVRDFNSAPGTPLLFHRGRIIDTEREGCA